MAIRIKMAYAKKYFKITTKLSQSVSKVIIDYIVFIK